MLNMMSLSKLRVQLLLKITRPRGTIPTEYHRVIWCPFIPDDCDDSSVTESSTQDASRVLVLTHGEKVLFNIYLDISCMKSRSLVCIKKEVFYAKPCTYCTIRLIFAFFFHKYMKHWFLFVFTYFNYLILQSSGCPFKVLNWSIKEIES